MSGYENYYMALKNKINDYARIDIKDEEGLLLLKHWINDRNEVVDIGGTILTDGTVLS